MAKTLARSIRRLHKQPENEGQPATFLQYQADRLTAEWRQRRIARRRKEKQGGRNA